MSKINVNTECQLSFAAVTREYIEAGKEKMELFGSVNKACVQVL